MTGSIDIANLRRLLAAATPGPWSTDDVSHGQADTFDAADADAALIAALVNAAPELLDLVDALSAERDATFDEAERRRERAKRAERQVDDLEAKLAAAEERARIAADAARLNTRDADMYLDMMEGMEQVQIGYMKRIAELEAFAKAAAAAEEAWAKQRLYFTEWNEAMTRALERIADHPKGHNDTCSHALAAKCECDCHVAIAREALRGRGTE